MAFYNVLFFSLTVVFSTTECLPAPGGSVHHVHHRIHVPQKIKTVYHTKIIKVPEHHHHFHEKEKIVIEKEAPKTEHHAVSIKDDEYDFAESTNVYKKKRYVRPPATASKSTKFKKTKIVNYSRRPKSKDKS
ncbi:uncharacterized protein LOC115887353 [Sitophilus oryzae]|uniref:Uncharacterized protein LOC115887353 n=1 Tax=Sitophilus oryzae TaxID=7048 RepID=A0A6J2YH80_SITOR|nr:uncharacterized protein LOC115887353 [Sitophilus oryzae]